MTLRLFPCVNGQTRLGTHEGTTFKEDTTFSNMNSLQECTGSSEVSNTKHSTDEKNDSGVPSSGSPRSLRNFSYKPILWSAGGRAGARLAI